MAMTSEIEKLIKRLESATDAGADEIVEALVQAGPPAITPLSLALADEQRPTDARIGAADALAEIGQRHSEFARQCAAILRSNLERHLRNPIELNSAIVEDLVDLQARESISVIEQAFAGGDVDSDLCDNLDTIRRKLGVTFKPTSPPAARPLGGCQPKPPPTTPAVGRFAATPISEDSDEPLTFSASGAFEGLTRQAPPQGVWDQELRPHDEAMPAPAPFSQQPGGPAAPQRQAPARPGFGTRRALTPRERERLKARRKQSRQSRKKNRRG
jgi:hypothetical protein